MKKDLLKVSIRQNAIYLPPVEGMGEKKKLTSTTVALVAQLRKMGYGVSEELLHTINEITPAEQMEVFQVMKEVLGVNLNWAPLVKGWDTPTGETQLDHLITWITNLFQIKKGVKLPWEQAESVGTLADGRAGRLLQRFIRIAYGSGCYTSG